MALRPVVGFSLAGMASLLTRPFRRAAGAGPLWRRRRSLPNSAGPSSNQRQGVAVPNLRCCTKAFVEPGTNNPVMVDQGERFIGDDFFELILGRAGARDVRRPRLGRHMIDPMPTERVVVDREFPCSSLKNMKSPISQSAG